MGLKGVTKRVTGWLVWTCMAIVVIISVGVGIVTSYDSTVITTQVNITQSLPTVSAIAINSGASINLSEGTERSVVCNATVVDYNGLADIDKVNSTFFRANGTAAEGYGAYGAQNNNSRYHNVNCSYNATIAAFTFSYLCDFNVTYYAFNGTWNCTVWVNNTLNRPNNGSSAAAIFPLFAINVSASADFGNLGVLDTSNAVTVNVTNFGNMPLNLTVYGYGGSANGTGGGKAFDCPSGSNISVSYLHYTITGDVDYSTMTALTSGPTLINGMTIARQSGDQMQFNTTYWKLNVPPNPFGICNGTIVYDAIQGGNN